MSSKYRPPHAANWHRSDSSVASSRNFNNQSPKRNHPAADSLLTSTLAQWDKKYLLSLAKELASVAKVITNSGQQEIFGENNFSRLSECLSRLSEVRFPFRLPSWNKEVSSVCAAISMIPLNALSALDYASISRFFTRAYSEKQLQLSEQETLGMYNTLFSFLKSGGLGCRC